MLRAVHRSRRLVPVSISLCNLPLAGGDLVSVAVVHDISLLHAHLDRATLQAQTDALTGLGNRLMLSHQMQADLENGRPFGLLLDGLTDTARLHERASAVVESLVRPMRLDGVSVAVGVNIGGAVYPRHGETEPALLAAADGAMYRAKRTGEPYRLAERPAP